MLLVAEVEPVLEVPVGADLAPEVPTNVEDLVPEVIIVIDAIVAVAVKAMTVQVEVPRIDEINIIISSSSSIPR